jgi:hypothetical protein
LSGLDYSCHLFQVSRIFLSTRNAGWRVHLTFSSRWDIEMEMKRLTVLFTEEACSLTVIQSPLDSYCVTELSTSNSLTICFTCNGVHCRATVWVKGMYYVNSVDPLTTLHLDKYRVVTGGRCSCQVRCDHVKSN